MNLKGKFLTVLTFYSCHISMVWAQCNECLTTYQLACVSDTQYQFCVNNVPTGAVNTCPINYVCSTATPAICQPNVAGVAPTCSNCNVCDANGIFACTSVNTYALCLNSNIPSAITASCGTLICNVELPEICGDPLTGATATCPTANGVVTTTTSRTPSLTTPSTLPTYAQFLCLQIRVNGRFSYPLDTTCKSYLNCFLTTNGTWSGQIYTCAGSTYFDPTSRYCVANRPTGCV